MNFLLLPLLLVSALLYSASNATPIGFPSPTAAGDCKTSISTSKNKPLYITPLLATLYPNEGSKTTITIPANTAITISCTDSTFTTNPFKNLNHITATCSNSKLTANNVTVNLPTLACLSRVSITPQYTDTKCENGGEELQIGYQITANSYARNMRLCFDQQNHNALYSTFNLSRYIGAHESGVARPTFSAASFYADIGVSVDKLYSRGTQRATINKLLGLPATSTKYIKDDNYYFLSRGHLTPKAAFVYGHEQISTFYFVNAAPQWQTFNGRNWENVEVSTRDYADAQDLDLVVYTGTYGVATLPHAETGEDTELWLYVQGNKKGIAVPAVYWKVVYEPVGRRGVAFVGVNNPYKKDAKEGALCKDVSEKVTWAKWNKDDDQYGHVYACDVNELRQKVDFLPKFEVGDLLV